MDPPTEGTNLPNNVEAFSSEVVGNGLPKEFLPEPQRTLVEQTPEILDVLQDHMSGNVFQDAKIDIPDNLGTQVRDILQKNREFNAHEFPETLVEKPKDSETRVLNENNTVNNSVEEHTPHEQIKGPTKMPFGKAKPPLPKYREIPSDYPNGPRKYIRRKDKHEIRPARRIPKYLPDVDGNMWKVWPYPDAIELSTDSEEEVVEVPKGFRIDNDRFVKEDPNVQLTPPVYKRMVKSLLGVFIVVNIYKYGWILLRKFKQFVSRKEEPEKIPGASEEDSEEEETE